MGFLSGNPSEFEDQADSEERPVERASWQTCQEFLRAVGGRVPTEVEWEYACRAVSTLAYPNGSNDTASTPWFTWFVGNSGAEEDPRGETHPAGLLDANDLGLHDMLGTVFEWCSDWYGDYRSCDVIDSTGLADGVFRVTPGGSWSGAQWRSPPIGTPHVLVLSASSSMGVRVARDP